MGVSSSWEQRLRQDTRRVFILDDDPTGTQTVSNVEVILRPDLDAYRRFLAGDQRSVYVLTNSRALSRHEAVRLLTHISTEIMQAADEMGAQVALLLRGDSTLRGHVFAEMDVLASPFSNHVGLFVPAFPEGGRITLDGIHYLLIDNKPVPVAQTEFARDATFGYRSERLVDWAAEVGNGRPALSVPLDRLRAEGPALLTRLLLEAPPGTILVPDAQTRDDLEQIAWGLLDAEQQGRHIVVRSASTFAAIRAGLQGKTVSAMAPLEGALLVVCGSHTQASSRQLQRLIEQTSAPVILPTDWLLREGQETVVPRLTQQISLNLTRQKFALLATERVRRPEHSDLAVGAQVMDALTWVVRQIASDCDAVIVKGGISSAQVATDGLQAVQAIVRGQLTAGVSLWDLALPDGRQIPYVVIPGNVGTDETLLDIVRLFQAAPLRSANNERPALQLQPIEQKSLVAEITQRLLDYLLSGEIKPGTRLPSERQLSEALGLGRSTVRESLKALTLLGLLEVRQGDGTYLRKADSALLPRVIEWSLLLGEKRTLDLVEARLKIEIIIAELAAQRRDSFAIEELRVLLLRMQNAGLHYQEFVDADVAFHLKLADIAKNTVLRDILSSIQALLRTWIIRVIESAGNTTFSYEEHRLIFEAVAQGDPVAAAAAMQAHMDSARRRLFQTIRQQ